MYQLLFIAISEFYHRKFEFGLKITTFKFWERPTLKACHAKTAALIAK
jgi:hypothetical protein